MITFKVNVPEASLKTIKAAIDRKVAEVLEFAALKTYNYILTHEYPYWSGAYVSSWNISVGSPDTSFNVSKLDKGVYLPPEIRFDLGTVGANDTIFISNYASHSYQIEYDGTPRHDGGYYIANQAVNNTLMSSKYF